MVKPELCVKCRGGKYLCGLSHCPLLVRHYVKTASSRELYGSSPPTVFVTRRGVVKPAAPPEVGDTSHYETPQVWLEMPIERFLAMRLSLLYGAVKDARRLQELQLLALSQRPVEVEMYFKKLPTGVQFNEYTPPTGPTAPLRRFKLAGEPKLPKAAERLHGDYHAKAGTAIVEMYRAGLDVSYITRALSVGTLGVKRRLVPTRWAITAVDKTLSDWLVDKVKKLPEINEYYLYARRTTGNLFLAILAPGAWAYEWGEAFEPNTVWNPGGALEVATDFELYRGRSDYPEIGGCYYAARLAAAEALYAMGRQAAVVIWREVYTGFTTPVGVWWVRENARAMFREKPVKLDTLEEALEAASYILKTPLDVWLKASRLIPVLKSSLFPRHGY